MELRLADGRPAAMRHARAAARRTRTGARSSRTAITLAVLLVAALVVAACGASGPGASAASSVSTSGPSAGPVGTPEAAVAAIRARAPWFDGIEVRDPELIGQAAAWQAETTDDGLRVTFEVGWGDCQAGCIDRHTWTWDVAPDGTVSWVAEEGSELSPEQLAALAAAATTAGVGGRVTGGPTCPVEVPGDPACAGLLVAGAVLVVKGAGGEIARFTTDDSGFYRIALPPGSYTLEAGPVEGFMSAPAPEPFTVVAGALTALDLTYDTGIR